MKNIYINESHWLYTLQIYTVCKSSVEISHTHMEELLNLMGFGWLSISRYCFRRATFSKHTFSKVALFHSYTSFPHLRFLFLSQELDNIYVQ